MSDFAEVEAFLAQLRQEFVDSSFDRLDELESLINVVIQCGERAAAAMLDLRRHVHSMKGSAGTHGFPVVSQIAHRIEDYLENVDDIGVRQLTDVQTHLDRIREIFENGHDPDSDTAAEMFRRLPAPVPGDAADEIVRTVHALLVMPKSVQRKIVVQQLVERGLQVSMVATALNAMKAALTERPDLIIASQEIEDFSGAELAGVYAAIRATSRCRFVLVTSHDKDDPALSGLPKTAALIRKGRGFSEEIGDLLTTWGM